MLVRVSPGCTTTATSFALAREVANRLVARTSAMVKVPKRTALRRVAIDPPVSLRCPCSDQRAAMHAIRGRGTGGALRTDDCPILGRRPERSRYERGSPGYFGTP